MSEKYIVKESKAGNDIKSCIIIGLYDDYEGFRIILENDTGVFGVYFEDNLIYRNADEGDRLGSLSALSNKKNELGIIYEVEDSEFIKWFVEENSEKYNKSELMHTAVLSQNDWIDVISLTQPKIKNLTE